MDLSSSFLQNEDDGDGDDIDNDDDVDDDANDSDEKDNNKIFTIHKNAMMVMMIYVDRLFTTFWCTNLKGWIFLIYMTTHKLSANKSRGIKNIDYYHFPSANKKGKGKFNSTQG